MSVGGESLAILDIWEFFLEFPYVPMSLDFYVVIYDLQLLKRIQNIS